jgi:hypothetical protein
VTRPIEQEHLYLARDFKEINQKIKNLLKPDREADPGHFYECIEDIVSGAKRSPNMSSLLDQSPGRRSPWLQSVNTHIWGIRK